MGRVWMGFMGQIQDLGIPSFSLSLTLPLAFSSILAMGQQKYNMVMEWNGMEWSGGDRTGVVCRVSSSPVLFYWEWSDGVMDEWIMFTVEMKTTLFLLSLSISWPGGGRRAEQQQQQQTKHDKHDDV